MHICIQTCRNPYFQMLVIVFRWCLMIISCFFCNFVGPQIRRYADMQIRRYADMQIRRYADMQIRRYADMQIHRYSDTQMRR